MLPPETLAEGAAGAPATAEVSEFEALLNKEFKAREPQKQTAVQNAVRTLAQQALGATQLISSDVTKTISAMIAEIDKKLSEQINLILHHEDFKSLEGTWRGLHHLVKQPSDRRGKAAVGLLLNRVSNAAAEQVRTESLWRFGPE